VLPCARIGTLAERTQHVPYWRAKFEETDALANSHGPGILADADLADYRRMETFVGKTPDMLRLVLDVLNPRTLLVRCWKSPPSAKLFRYADKLRDMPSRPRLANLNSGRSTPAVIAANSVLIVSPSIAKAREATTPI
jgi:hypothetical protein